MFPLNSENLKLFTFNTKDTVCALEQIFGFFQSKKEETKSSTCSNLSNYSSIDVKGFNKNRIITTNETCKEKFHTNKTNNFHNLNFLDTNTNSENCNNYIGDFDHGDFFMMNNFI